VRLTGGEVVVRLSGWVEVSDRWGRIFDKDDGIMGKSAVGRLW
jgi:hypothetical protein